MAQPNHTPRLAETEEALTILFCLVDDAYALLNPRGARRYESIKRLSDSEVIALALFQQLRGVESERSFLRDAERFFSHLFPGVGGTTSPFLVLSAGEEAQALFGASAAGCPLRDGRRAGDVACGLDFAFGFAPQAGFSGLGLPRRRVGKVGFVQRLRGEAAPHLCYQWGSSLLRAHPRQRRRRLPGRGTHLRGGFGGGGSEEALGRPGLPEQATEGGFGRGRHPLEYRTIRAAAWSQAAYRDRHLELEEGLWPRQDVGDHSGGTGHQDRSQDLRLHTYAFMVNRMLGRPQGHIKELWA